MTPPPAPTPASDRLLEAAAVCFSARGFDATRTADITKEAGVSTGLLFHHFDSKHGLLLALIARDAADIGAITVPAQPADARQTLLEVLSATCEQADDPVLGPLALEIARVARRDPEVAELVQQSDRSLRGATARLAAAGGSTVPTDIAGTWIAALIDGVFSRVATQPGFVARERIPELHALITGFLGW